MGSCLSVITLFLHHSISRDLVELSEPGVGVHSIFMLFIPDLMAMELICFLVIEDSTGSASSRVYSRKPLY
jgi:hypothetical protein